MASEERPCLLPCKRPAAATRRTFKGTSADLFEVLKKHATSPRFCTYPEDADNTVKEEMLKHADMIRDLVPLSSNMSFQKTKVQEAVGEIWEIKDSLAWEPAVDARFEKDWVTDTSNRLLKLFRHVAVEVAKSRSKRGASKWFLKMMEITIDDAGQHIYTHSIYFLYIFILKFTPFRQRLPRATLPHRPIPNPPSEKNLQMDITN